MAKNRIAPEGFPDCREVPMKQQRGAEIHHRDPMSTGPAQGNENGGAHRSIAYGGTDERIVARKGVKP